MYVGLPSVFVIPRSVASTVTVAVLEVVPVPPFVEETLPVVLFFAPAVAPVIVTLKVQLPPAAIEPPVNAITPVPAVVVNVPPPHCAVEVVATVKTAGKVSETATPVNAVPAFGFVIVKVSVVVPANGIVAAPNALVIVGGAMTVTVSEPVLFASLASEILLFGSTVTVFTRLPAAVGVTAKVMLKDAFVGKVTVPFAVHVKVVPAIEQLSVPVGGVAPLVTATEPAV